MKISTKGRYALRMMLDLATHQKDGYVALKEIAQRQNISKKYLEQIVISLNQAKFLRSNRGFQGGYRLVKEADKIRVWDILKATEECMAPVACLADEVNLCPRKEECETLWLWEGLYQATKQYLNSITLQDMLDHNTEKAIDYYVI